jgi:hypothetical protein
MGGRMMNKDSANLTVEGILTDTDGPRTAQLIVQAPGYMRFQESSEGRVLTFDGTQFKSKKGDGGVSDLRIRESLMAHLPDAVFLQIAGGGSLRLLGSHFRTDDGRTPNYRGPYWTLYVFSPLQRPGLTPGQPLQQHLFIAIDDESWLISEIRTVSNARTPAQQVTQTRFSNWLQVSGQWFPGQIVRLENGRQVLSFQAQQTTVGSQAATSIFEP